MTFFLSGFNQLALSEDGTWEAADDVRFLLGWRRL